MEKNRDFLVFARVGKNSLHHRWLSGDTPRNWDLQLSQYDDAPDIGKGGDLPLSKDKGTKWDSIYRYLTANPDVFERYQYIMFMDDDLDISGADLNKFFEICRENDLLVAQPSLHPGSYFCYPILLQCPSMKLRFSNFVECMAPALRTDHLKDFLPRMANVKSGWGLDHIWTVSMEDPSYRAAIVDEISMLHTRPHNTAGGIKKAYDSGAVSPSDELEEIRKTYQHIPDKMLVYGGITLDGGRTGGAATRMKNGLHLALSATDLKNSKRGRHGALGMLLRSVTQIGYKPKQIVPVEGRAETMMENDPVSQIGQ